VSTRRAIVIAARRTAIGKLGGLHRRRPVEELAAPVIQAVIADSRLDPQSIDEVILGNAVGGGGNPARLSALAAGLPDSVPAITVDRQCASGLDAIIAGARAIETGAAEAVIAGGAESASTAPWRIAKPANIFADLPRFYSQPAFSPRENGDPGMIEAAENIARRFGITREQQDAFALRSHRLAIEAMSGGVIGAEIVPLSGMAAESHDEGPRPSLSSATLARMPPLSATNGAVTAGNSCQINDGAAMVALVSEDLHRRLGSPPGLAFSGAASAGIEPDILGLAAVPAARRLFGKYGLAVTDFAEIELNEAFASQVLASAEQLEIGIDRLNIHGGAIAYGHPYGASGALLVVRLFTRLLRQSNGSSGKRGLALIAAAGGVGVAAAFLRDRRII
jgi:acetyl-CoA C-acetyltransferase